MSQAVAPRRPVFRPASLAPVVTSLNPEQRALKARVIAAYRSQAAVLRLAPADLAADPGKLEFELSWRVRMDALGALAGVQAS